MKTLLFFILFASFLIMFAGLLLTNIYLLGISELLIIPTIVLLVRLNLSTLKN